MGSVTTLTNGVKEEMTPILLKKKSASAPESDSSDSIYDATHIPKKKLSLDETLLHKNTEDEKKSKEFIKEQSHKMQEKDLDETSNCSSFSRVKTISPAATLTSVNSNFLKYQL